MFNNKYLYYIDESGNFKSIDNGGSKVFSVGCVIVNNIEKTVKNITKLHKNINNSAFFERHRTNKYFHACDDHLDVYFRYIELLNSLDFRAYVLVLNKKTEYFNELMRDKSEKEIYDELIFKLLYDRLLKRKNSINLLIFERLNNKLNKEKEEKEGIIFNINKVLQGKALIESDLNFSVEIKITIHLEILSSCVLYILTQVISIAS